MIEYNNLRLLLNKTMLKIINEDLDEVKPSEFVSGKFEYRDRAEY